MTPSVKVIADSVSLSGDRVTTLECVMHRFVLAEFNTHRAFSRNSASSRAIPVPKQLRRVIDNPAIPLAWPAEKKGMQGGEPLDSRSIIKAERAWEQALSNAVASAEELVKIGVHKSVTNRLLEPFMWHTVCCTSTEWENFFKQRCSPLAQPEIQAVAYIMRDVIKNSTPRELQFGEFHLPYVDAATIREVTSSGIANPRMILAYISAMRCARTSYLTQDGVRDYKIDLTGYERLIEADPPHWSPLEHVCRPKATAERQVGNLVGYTQLRHIVSGEAAVAGGEYNVPHGPIGEDSL